MVEEVVVWCLKLKLGETPVDATDRLVKMELRLSPTQGRIMVEGVIDTTHLAGNLVIKKRSDLVF